MRILIDSIQIVFYAFRVSGMPFDLTNAPAVYFHGSDESYVQTVL